jgi:outer membrane lipoprotein carrier protein
MLVLTTAVIFLAPARAQQDRAKMVAAAVDQKYNTMKTLKADFVEIYQGPGFARQESGVLELKRPGKMRWDYKEPHQKLFISDGKTAYFYVPGERQARRAPVKKLDDIRSPLRYLLGKARISEELDDLKVADGVAPLKPGNMILSGIPKHLKDRVSQVLLEINAGEQIERIIIEEVDGTTTEFRFSNLVENQPMADAQFHFSPPQGVEMIEAEELTGG